MRFLITAMHGFDCDHADSYATYLTNDPRGFDNMQTIVDCYKPMYEAARAGSRLEVAA